MRKIIQKKEALTDFYADKIKNASTVVVFKYLGLDAQDMTNLRKEMLKNTARMHVLKNNIIIRSLAKAGFNQFENLVGANAIIIGNGDAILPLKSIQNLIKENDFIKFEGSIVENNYLNEVDTQVISKLPNREAMYTMFLSCLTSPIRNFLYGLKAVADTKIN